jgi:hypothetical protein
MTKCFILMKNNGNVLNAIVNAFKGVIILKINANLFMHNLVK